MRRSDEVADFYLIIFRNNRLQIFHLISRSRDSFPSKGKPWSVSINFLQNPSVTDKPCRRLAAARSRRGSDSPPDCHSLPRRHFATLHGSREVCADFPIKSILTQRDKNYNKNYHFPSREKSIFFEKAFDLRKLLRSTQDLGDRLVQHPRQIHVINRNHKIIPHRYLSLNKAFNKNFEHKKTPSYEMAFSC